MGGMPSDTVLLANRPVRRMGFGAMQLPGPGVFGPPKDRAVALAVIRRAVEAGVNHIDTAQFYGPDVANELLHEALYPYPDDLVLVSKVGAARNDKGEWLGAQRPEELRAGVEANLRSLELDQIPVVNLRRHPESDVPFADQLDEMIALRDEGLIAGIGLSNASLEQYDRGAGPDRGGLRPERLQPGRPLRPGGVRRLPGRRGSLRAVLPVGIRPSTRRTRSSARRRSKRRPAVSGRRRPRWRWPGCCTWRPMSS